MDAHKRFILDAISANRKIDTARFEQLTIGDWASICHIAKQHRLGPILHHHCSLRYLDRPIPDHVRAEWSGAFKKAALRSLAIRQTLVSINSILSEAGIPYAALKGAWLAQYAYEHPALRPMRDIDIVVAPGKVLTAFRLLERHGFARQSGTVMPSNDAIDTEKHLPPLWRAKTGVSVEVHSRLTHDAPREIPTGSLDDVASLLNRVELREGINFLSPTDTLLHLIVHSAYDHTFNNGPLILTDVAAILRLSKIDWPRFWKMVHLGNWVRGCQLVFSMVGRYHDTSGIEHYTSSSPQPSVQQIDCACLLTLQDTEQSSIIGFQSRIAGSRDWRTKFAIALRQAFPPLHTLAEFANTSSASHWTLIHYPRWLLAQATALLRAKGSSDVSMEVERAATVRGWVSGV